ncbi:YcxB family protein [Prescottella agglutinans]|uniref:Transposase-like protein n=1 Tax=Prescottella agglutinans TaxID=1644129 RepID=A0ABT6M6H6_9NOCA|nr:YcxB family protein [Prescottella agglutinans]MDH6279893.1 transposase-like protein [Prescottella agglutinans]
MSSYEEVENTVRECAAHATAAAQVEFGIAVTRELLTADGVAAAAAAELTEAAARAVSAAADAVGTASAEQLRAWIVEIDEGDLSDGDMDSDLLRAITALEAWADYLEDRSSERIAALGIALLEQADFRASGAPLDDFLGTPENRQSFERIRAALTEPAMHGSGPRAVFENSITIDAADKAAVRRAFVDAAVSRRLRITGMIALPIALVVGMVSALSGRTVGVFAFGVIATLTLLLVVLTVVLRRVAAKAVDDGMGVGSRLTVRIDADGLGLEGRFGSSHAPWNSLSGAERIKGGIVFRNVEGKAAFFVPGRALDDSALALVEEYIDGIGQMTDEGRDRAGRDRQKGVA